MPETAAVKPTGDGSPNNCLSSLSVNDFSLTPTFSKFTTEYTMIVDKSVASVEVNAAAIISTTQVTGTGTYELQDGANTIQVVATAENGVARTYTITIVRQDPSAGDGNIETDENGETITPGESGESGESGETTAPGESGSDTTPPATEPTIPPFSMSTTLKTNSDNSVTGITPGTSIADIIAQITVSGGTVEILTPDEKVKTEGNIATGDMIAGKDESGNYVSVYTVVIYGDVNGDGNVSIKDLLLLRKCILGTGTLEGTFLQAGNANKDQNGITIKDILVLRKQLLGTATIDQN